MIGLLCCCSHKILITGLSYTPFHSVFSELSTGSDYYSSYDTNLDENTYQSRLDNRRNYLATEFDYALNSNLERWMILNNRTEYPNYYIENFYESIDGTAYEATYLRILFY